MSRNPFTNDTRKTAGMPESPWQAPSRWRPAKRKGTWANAILFFCASVFFAVCIYDYMHADWTPPARSALTKVTGVFVGRHTSEQQPYVFRTQSGDTIQLGCAPRISLADCLKKDGGTSPEELGGATVTIGYFQVQALWWQRRRGASPNVLVTVDQGDRHILPYSASKAHLDRVHAFSRKSRWMVPIVMLPVTALFLYLSVVIAIRQLKRES